MKKTNVKLSEAIRRGSRLTKPATDHFFTRDDEGNLCACALGAAMVGAKPQILRRKKLPNDNEGMELLGDIFGTDITWVNEERTRVGVNVFYHIINLNDIFEASRGEIAAKLEEAGL